MCAVQLHAVRACQLDAPGSCAEFNYQLLDFLCFQRPRFLFLQTAGHRGGGCDRRKYSSFLNKLGVLCNLKEDIPISVPMAANCFAHAPGRDQQGEILAAWMMQLTENFCAMAVDSLYHSCKWLNMAVFTHRELTGSKGTMLFIHTRCFRDDKPHAAPGTLLIILHHLLPGRTVKAAGSQNHWGHDDTVFQGYVSNFSLRK